MSRAATANDRVVAVTAKKSVIAVAAGDRVVAGAAVDGQRNQRGQSVARGESIVAAIHVDDEVLAGADVEREGSRIEAIEPDASAVGGHGKVFGAVAAVHLDGVDAVASFVQVRAFAGIPDHPVVAGLAENLIVAGAAGQGVVSVAAEELIIASLTQQDIVARLAEELVVAGAASQCVVAVAAEEVRGRQCPIGLVQRDFIVSSLAKDLDERRIGDRRRAPLNGNRPAVDEELTGGVAADDDRVVLRVANDGQHTGAGRERRCDREREALAERLKRKCSGELALALRGRGSRVPHEFLCQSTEGAAVHGDASSLNVGMCWTGR